MDGRMAEPPTFAAAPAPAPAVSDVPAPPGIETFPARLPGGTVLACRAAGTGPVRVLLLHGFPEAAFAWDEVLQSLAPHARAVAPNLRGYIGSSAPADTADYKPRLLVADVAELIAQLGAPVDVLVAHDWGGALAWNLAALQPALCKRLVIVNSPHPATFLRELRHNPRQQAASRYMNFLARPDAAALLAENDFARLWPFFTNMGGTAWLDEPMRARYRQAWSAGLAGPVAWYRASPLRPPVNADDAVMTLQLPDEAVTSRVPTTVIWGDGDTALLPGLLDGLERWVPQLQLLRVPQATHWVVHEQLRLIVDRILRELALA
jgi:pimeloyl-ACP methyl ester carboxylesterase